MKYLFPLFIVLFSISCQKKKIEEQAKKDDEILKQYISDHNLNAVPTGTGLYYVIDNQGTGINPTKTSQVKIYYKGYFTDGSVFDECDSTGIILGLNQVIDGWTEGIPYFKEGGNGKLLIPSALGYGPNGTQGIPKNSVLVFDIHLIHVY